MNTVKGLTKEQISAIAEIIIDDLDGGCSKEAVTELVLTLFEDISGLELLTESEKEVLTNDIWKIISQQ